MTSHATSSSSTAVSFPKLSDFSLIDLSKHYYIAEIRGPSGVMFVCLIPLNLLPASKVQEAIGRGVTTTHAEVMKKPMLERLKHCENNLFKGKSVWIVENTPSPTDRWVIKRLHKRSNGKVIALDCTEEYKRRTGKPLQEWANPKGADMRVASTQAGPSMSVTSSSVFTQDLPLNSTGQSIVPPATVFKIGSIIGTFKASVGKVISRHGFQLCPTEPIRLLWDSLSQSILYNHPMPEETRSTLSGQLLDYWQEVQWNFTTFLNGCIQDNQVNANNARTALLKQLESFDSRLSISDPSLATKLFHVLQPLKNAFSKVGEDAPWLEIKYLAALFSQINMGLLKDLHDVSIEMRSQPEALKRWLEFRMTTLERYLHRTSQDPIAFFIARAYAQISVLIKNRQWISVYELIKQTEEEASEAFRPRLIDQDTLKVSGIVRTQTMQSMEDHIILRQIHFLRAFMKDLEFCIVHGKLFSIVSQEANVEMIESYKGVSTKVQPHLQTPLNVWLNQLARFEGSHLKQELSDFNASWQALREIKKGLMNDPALRSLIERLQEQIRTENYQDLHSTYHEIAHHLNEPVKAWERELKRISPLIESIQVTCLVLLYDPKAPAIDANTLKEGFSLFNQQLLKIAQPVTQFFNAFQQLICMEASSSASSSGPQLLFTEEGSFTLSLFTQDDGYFQELEEYLTALKPMPKASLQIEAPAASSSEAPAEPSFSEIISTVKEIFSATKTKKIEGDITQFLTSQRIGHHIEPGKGSHSKLYIDGINVPIILPAHEEWKPGTKKSIENDLLEQLRIRLGTLQPASSSTQQ